MTDRDIEFLLGLAVWILAEDTRAQLEPIHRKLDRILRMEHQEMADLSRITDEVTQNTDATQSAITLLGELAQLVRDAGTDPAALAALADQLDANSTSLAEAVTANTPAAP